MRRFIAVHPLAFSEDQLRPLAKEPLPEGVTWHGTFSAFADERSYCHWEAPAKESVVEIFTKYEIPYEAIHEVRQFDPSTGLMEPEPIAAEIPQLV